jgi:hypothetical protein
MQQPIRVESIGQPIDEHTFKAGLQAIAPGFHFDMGAALNLYHPRMAEWQGVFYNGEHITSMARGVLPEFNIYGVNRYGTVTHLIRPGWRHTMKDIVGAGIPGVTWEALCLKFGVEYKHYRAGSTKEAA